MVNFIFFTVAGIKDKLKVFDDFKNKLKNV